MLKYDFSVKTREGQRLESIVIGGIDRSDAGAQAATDVPALRSTAL